MSGFCAPYTILNGATNDQRSKEGRDQEDRQICHLCEAFVSQSTNVIRKIFLSMLLTIISITFGIIGYVCVSLGNLSDVCAKHVKPRTISVRFGRLDTSIATESSL
ncbi:hypothetical protein TNCV_1282511 [Trichonephila clavipes]|uniref:Uncharacterized protein n=1 Tax=Trichonephila clavipes TaxID=2585209 RepID=A0A8X6SZF0_TRICX|nr:hypothetical protein TNCV_1282511 [Trichonephila clavipes]